MGWKKLVRYCHGLIIPDEESPQHTRRMGYTAVQMLVQSMILVVTAPICRQPEVER